MHLRVLSYNIHKCAGGVDRRTDPGRIADVIAHHDPDVALLQEAARVGRPDPVRQTEDLAERLGFPYRSYFTNVRKRGSVEYGNAVLSRFPITDTSNIDLTIPPKKKRAVLHCRCRVRRPSGRTFTFHVFNLHLGLSGLERKMQLRKFLESHPFAGLHPETPILIGGDFNDVWGTLGALLEPAGFRSGSKPIRTFPAIAPVRALDSIYVRGRVDLERLYTSRLALARQASDHRPLIADLKVRRKAPSARKA